jgi:geranylgeranyl pyrophosphate synthase
MAFQVQDDILDVTADQSKLGKKVGSDFEMHKQTILSIKLRQKIGTAAFNALDLAAYRNALKDEGILQEMSDVCEGYFEKARGALQVFRNTPHKEIMLEFTEQIRKRSF